MAREESSMPQAIGSGCINHPSVEAAGRCKQCGKPFCSACEVQGATGRFCSDPCKDRHEVFVKRAAKLDDMRRTSGVFGKLVDRFKKVAVFAVALLIIGVVLHFLNFNVPILSGIIESVL